MTGAQDEGEGRKYKRISKWFGFFVTFDTGSSCSICAELTGA